MGKNEYLNFGDKIRNIRIQKGLTQKEAAEKLGLAYSTYSNYENNNRTPKYNTLKQIAEGLEVPIDELISASFIAPMETDFEAAHSDDTVYTDEKDIAKDMEHIRQKLISGADGPLSYDGEPIPEEDTELLLGQIELMIRRLKPINKEKYNPNKSKK